MPIWIWILIFILSLIALVKASDFFNTSAEDIGLGMNIAPFTIGLILLSIGTSLPELVSSVFAVIAGASEVVAGNVVGSNIANIFFVLGLSALLYKKPIQFDYGKIRLDMVFLLISSAYLVLCFTYSRFIWWEGLLGLVLFSVYMFMVKRRDKISEKQGKHKINKKSLIIFPLSLIMLYLGAKYTIESLIVIADNFYISQDTIAASAIALATSLPELFVSLDALKKGKNEMAAGNIVGSCVFNAFIVMGLPALIDDLVISQRVIFFYAPFMLLGAISIFFISYKRIYLNRWIGLAFFLIYIVFIALIFMPSMYD